MTELWQRALARKKHFGARARLQLVDLLRECGHEISLVTVGTWSPKLQNKAYLWGQRVYSGLEDGPPPWI